MLVTARSFPTTQRLHSFKLPWSKMLFTALPDCCPLRRTPFSDLVRMRTCCLVPRSENHGHCSPGNETSAHIDYTAVWTPDPSCFFKRVWSPDPRPCGRRKVAREQGYSYALQELPVMLWYVLGRPPIHCYNCSVKKM